MTEAEKAYQYFVIAVPENEEQAKAYFWARKALQPTLIPPKEPERAGLYGKYTVYKNKDGSLVTDCFILRPAKDPAAVAALRAYAATTDNAELAADIINWVGAEPNEPLTCDGCISLGTSYGPCMNCIRSRLRGDMYRCPPEEEEGNCWMSKS